MDFDEGAFALRMYKTRKPKSARMFSSDTAAAKPQEEGKSGKKLTKAEKKALKQAKK